MSPEVRAADNPARSSRLASLCAMAVRTLPIDGAAIVLASTAGHRTLLASTDTRGEQLEGLLTTCREGPSIDAVAESRPVLADDLTDADTSARWPVFTGEALGLGVAAVFALPLQIGVINLGVFVASRGTAGALSTGDLSRVLRISDGAAFAILDLTIPAADESAPTDGHRDRAEIDDLAGGFVSSEIHQASGMLMVQLGLPIESALARLRAHAFAQERPLIDIAREVIARTLEFEG